jgi:manganese transport protein
MYGEQGAEQLLILSQVILSMQLSFAVVPLILFTSDRRKMGRFVNSLGLTLVAWFVAIVIISLNGYLLIDFFFG